METPEPHRSSRITQAFESLQNAVVAAAVTVTLTSFSTLFILGQLGYHSLVGLPASIGLDAAWQYSHHGALVTSLKQQAWDYYCATAWGSIVVGGTIGACLGLITAVNVVAVGRVKEDMFYKRLIKPSSTVVAFLAAGIIQLPIGAAVWQWQRGPVDNYVTNNLLRSSLCAAAGITLTNLALRKVRRNKHTEVKAGDEAEVLDKADIEKLSRPLWIVADES